MSPKIKKNMTQKRFPKNKRKKDDLTSQDDASNIEKYSKTLGVLFKITLLAYAQQCWKSDPKTLILESFLVAKSAQEWGGDSYIGTKIIWIFIQIFLRFWLHFGAHGAPKNSSFFIKLWCWYGFCGILAPGGCPKRSKSAPTRALGAIFVKMGRR